MSCTRRSIGKALNKRETHSKRRVKGESRKQLSKSIGSAVLSVRNVSRRKGQVRLTSQKTKKSNISVRKKKKNSVTVDKKP